MHKRGEYLIADAKQSNSSSGSRVLGCDHMMKVAVIGCTPSEILSACHTTIASLAKEGHMIYAIIAPSDELESLSSSLPEIANVPELAQPA